MKLPTLVVHADWSSHPDKRWLAIAVLENDDWYSVILPERVGVPGQLLNELKQVASPSGLVLLGVDFPIGLPIWYAERVGIDDFISILPEFGWGAWSQFYDVACQPQDIHLRRPFYPLRPGNARQAHLLNGLDCPSIDELRRRCEWAYPGRRAAAPIFWTMGGQQVGKAAINGWREMLAPALRRNLCKIWPFSGTFMDLISQRCGEIVVVEAYPAEFYRHLGITFPTLPKNNQLSTGQPRRGKRSQYSRAANADLMLGFTKELNIELKPDFQDTIRDGFGSGVRAEDKFDAFVGLLGMINILRGRQKLYEPQEHSLLMVEGWIFGQARND
jgi:hypothetical protein